MKPIEEIVPKLQSIIDTVEIIGLNDVEGWNSASSELLSVLPCIPDAFGVLSQILELSAQGINAIVLKTACNTFAAVEAVSQGVFVCKQSLEAGALSEELVTPVIQALQQIVSANTDLPEHLPDNADDSMLLQSDLNDLAMLWVQQEPEDAAGVSTILQSLVVFAEHAALHASVMDQISTAVEILNAMLLHEVDSLADAWV